MPSTLIGKNTSKELSTSDYFVFNVTSTGAENITLCDPAQQITGTNVQFGNTNDKWVIKSIHHKNNTEAYTLVVKSEDTLVRSYEISSNEGITGAINGEEDVIEALNSGDALNFELSATVTNMIVIVGARTVHSGGVLGG